MTGAINILGFSRRTISRDPYRNRGGRGYSSDAMTEIDRFFFAKPDKVTAPFTVKEISDEQAAQKLA